MEHASTFIYRVDHSICQQPVFFAIPREVLGAVENLRGTALPERADISHRAGKYMVFGYPELGHDTLYKMLCAPLIYFAQDVTLAR